MKRIVFTLLILCLPLQAFASPKRVALVLNVSIGDTHRGYTDFKKISPVLKTNFDKVIILDQARGKNFIPSSKNVRRILGNIDKADFLFVYYLGYGWGNRIALGKRFLSRKVFWSWIENARSFTIMDVISPSSALFDKKSAISFLANIQADPDHYRLLSRQKGFLRIFEEIICKPYKTNLYLEKFYKLITGYYLTTINRDISLIEMVPAPEPQNKVIVTFKSSESLPTTAKDTSKKPVKVAPMLQQQTVTGKPRQTAPKKVTKIFQETVVRKRIPVAKPVKHDYFKQVDFKPELGVFDLHSPPAGVLNPVNGHNITPFLSGAVLFGINVKDGSIEWKIPIDEKCSEYGINIVDEKYVFVLLQNEFNGVLKVIERSNGTEVNSIQIWGNLTYYQSYQQPFVTAKIGENYFSLMVLRKPGKTSEIRKITYNPKENKLLIKNYNLDYLVTSPLQYQSDLKSIYWGGKNRQTEEMFLGHLDLPTDQKTDYLLTVKNMGDFIIDDPPLVLPSGYTNMPHTLNFFVCFNRKVLSPKSDNLMAIYQLKRPGSLIPIEDFGNYKSFLRLVEEKIIKRDVGNPDYAYFDLGITNENQLKQSLNSFGEMERILDIWRNTPKPNLETPEHNLYKFKGRIISSPTLFKDVGVHNLNYVYFFSANPGQSGIQKTLTLFEPYFWQKGVYMGANDYSLPNLAKSNLMGVPLILKQVSDYLMLMASDEVYIYRYGKDSSGLKTWTQDYKYNEAVQEGLNSGELFHGISSSPIRQVDDTYLVKSFYHGHNNLYGFKLEKIGKTNYEIKLAWLFEGGNPISAPMAYLKDTDELSMVSMGKLLGIQRSALAESPKKGNPISRTVFKPKGFPENIFTEPVIYKDNIYWVSSGTMFSEQYADLNNKFPEKFTDISKKITTGISFWGDKFCYGTENNGVEIYTFEKDSFYSFFKLNDRVSSTPLIDEDMVYFATESEGDNYFYGMKLDSKNFFMLPNPAWEDQDKTFASQDSWRFNIKNAKMVSQPVSGMIGEKKVVFVGTTGGIIYAFDRKGGKNGGIKRPRWMCKLPRINEGVVYPVLFDPSNKVLFCLSNRGRLYILNPAHGNETTVFTIAETDDYRDFKATEMTLSQGNLCFSVTSKKLKSVFYCLNYKNGEYLRVTLPKEAVFKPLIVDNNAYVSCRSGEIYNIKLPPSFLIGKPLP